jgi:hypothetical protein
MSDLSPQNGAKRTLTRSLSPIVIREYAPQSVPLRLPDTARYFPNPAANYAKTTNTIARTTLQLHRNLWESAI